MTFTRWHHFVLNDSRPSNPLNAFLSPLHRQYLSYDVYLEVNGEDNQNCCVLCWVKQLCSVHNVHTDTNISSSIIQMLGQTQTSF